MNLSSFSSLILPGPQLSVRGIFDDVNPRASRLRVRKLPLVGSILATISCSQMRCLLSESVVGRRLIAVVKREPDY
jgi:hypothetical protein